MKWLNCISALVLASSAGQALALERAHLVTPENLSKYWLVSAAPEPHVPSFGTNLTAPSCAAVSYRIERGGSTSQVKLEKNEPAGDLGKVAVDIVKSLQYTAAAQNIGKDPVYTYVILPFNGPDVTRGPSAVAERQRIIDACKLDDFKLPEGS